MTMIPDPLASRSGGGGWLAVTPLTGRVGLRLTGEADLQNADILAKAIAGLPPAAGDIHFQLAGLDFIDVRATRELVRLAIACPGRRLLLHYPPPGLLKILRLGWPEARTQLVTATPRPPGMCQAAGDRPGTARPSPSGQPGRDHSSAAALLGSPRRPCAARPGRPLPHRP